MSAVLMYVSLNPPEPAKYGIEFRAPTGGVFSLCKGSVDYEIDGTPSAADR